MRLFSVPRDLDLLNFFTYLSSANTGLANPRRRSLVRPKSSVLEGRLLARADGLASGAAMSWEGGKSLPLL